MEARVGPTPIVFLVFSFTCKQQLLLFCFCLLVPLLIGTKTGLVAFQQQVMSGIGTPPKEKEKKKRWFSFGFPSKTTNFALRAHHLRAKGGFRDLKGGLKGGFRFRP